MIDSTATSLANGAINNLKPSSSADFYILVIVTGVVVCWGLFWFLKFKYGDKNNGGQNRDKATDEDVYRLHPEDRSRLKALEESVKTLADAFREIVHERGDLMKEIGEIKGAVDILKKSA